MVCPTSNRTHASIPLRKRGCISQKTEAPVRERQGVESYEERKSELDDVLTSPEANKDTELFGTEVGVADAMRFQGAAPELINSRYKISFGLLQALHAVVAAAGQAYL